jgi:hypothetical protein
MHLSEIRILLIPLLAWCAIAAADHRPDADWSWHVAAAGGDESRLSVYRREELFGIFDIACDLTDAVDGESADGNASISLLRPDTHPEGLLVIVCNVGAHSQMLTVVDLEQRSTQPAFTVTGSYSASWELQDGELWIGYDAPCDTGPTVDCPDGYKTTFVHYPGPPPFSND